MPVRRDGSNELGADKEGAKAGRADAPRPPGARDKARSAPSQAPQRVATTTPGVPSACSYCTHLHGSTRGPARHTRSGPKSWRGCSTGRRSRPYPKCRQDLGARSAIMRLPSMVGGRSIRASGSSCCRKWSSTRRPSSRCCTSRPRKMTLIKTLSLCSRKRRA